MAGFLAQFLPPNYFILKRKAVKMCSEQADYFELDNQYKPLQYFKILQYSNI